MFSGVFKGRPETSWSAALLLLKDISQTQAKESIPLPVGPALKKNSRNSDLDAVIAFVRTAMEFTPPGHPQRRSALIDLADILSERFDKEGTKVDVHEVITLRRDASQCMSTDDPQRLAIRLDLYKSLFQRFRSRGFFVDLEEIISLRRLKPFTQNIKNCSVDDIEEAIRLAHTASQLCPPEHPDLALSQEHLARHLRAKVRRGAVPVCASGLRTDPPSPGPSITEQLIGKVVFETLENIRISATTATHTDWCLV
ncbi:hypothetical protein EDD16DRAFT_1702005 [Pisolithus croceorrhizus]|nr:hypothetical protein EDD16DRAFT_1702005 [Pisolithus croceorrhizus]